MQDETMKVSAENTQDPLFAEYAATRKKSVRNEIVLKYMNIVKYVAMSTRNMYQKYTDYDDIINEATVALMTAVDSFDPGKNVKFETYASIRVRGAVIDYIRRQDIIPRNLRKFAKDYDAAFSKLYEKLGREPENEEIAEELGMSLSKLEKYTAGAASAQTLSFEEMVFEGGFDISDDENTDASGGWVPEQRLIGDESRDMLASAIDRLKEKERLVISLYYYEKLRYSEIAQVMDVSESRVCQLHSQAVTHLKKLLGDYFS